MKSHNLVFAIDKEGAPMEVSVAPADPSTWEVELENIQALEQALIKYGLVFERCLCQQVGRGALVSTWVFRWLKKPKEILTEEEDDICDLFEHWVDTYLDSDRMFRHKVSVAILWDRVVITEVHDE